jgi:hypothetical protein
VSDFSVNILHNDVRVPFNLIVRNGATSHGDYFLERFATMKPLFEEIDRSYLELVLAQGSKVVEWGIVSISSRGPPSTTQQTSWSNLQRQLASGRVSLVSSDDLIRRFSSA